MSTNPSFCNYPKAIIQTSMSTIDTMSSIVNGHKIPLFNAGLPHNKVAAQVASQTSRIQLKDTHDAHEENFNMVFEVMRVNMKMACFFCSDFKERGAMQRTALFPNVTRERIKDSVVLPAVIVADCQGLQHWRLLTESRGCSRWREIGVKGNQMGHNTAVEGTYFIPN